MMKDFARPLRGPFKTAHRTMRVIANVRTASASTPVSNGTFNFGPPNMCLYFLGITSRIEKAPPTAPIIWYVHSSTISYEKAVTFSLIHSLSDTPVELVKTKNEITISKASMKSSCFLLMPNITGTVPHFLWKSNRRGPGQIQRFVTVRENNG